MAQTAAPGIFSDGRLTRRRLLRQGWAAGAGLALFGLSGALAACGPTASKPGRPAVARTPSAGSGDWNGLVAAARREGRLSVGIGTAPPVLRQQIPPAFRKQFGIDVEFLAGNSSQLASRLAAEHSAGQAFSVDLMLAGSDTAYTTLYPNGWLAPLRPGLILPEDTDVAHWLDRKLWFRDPKGEAILQLVITATPTIAVNTGQVRPDEVATGDALLEPRFHGKICAFDPSVNGTGISAGSAFYVDKGAEFCRRLYVGQKVALSRDHRQIAEWVGHGTYPIAIAADTAFLQPYIQSGVPVRQFDLSDVRPTTGGIDLVCLLQPVPHPNAALLFANWLASRAGDTLYARSLSANPLRTDVDPTWVPADQRYKPDGRYLDTYDWTFETQQRIEIRNFYAQMMK